jgi:hypothetical protein
MASVAELNTKFGNPKGSNGKVNPTWAQNNLVEVELPYRMKIAWDLDEYVTHINFHKLGAHALEQALNAAYNQARILVKAKFGLNHDSIYFDEKTRLYLSDRRLDLYGGAYNYRTMRTNPNILSTHSWGIAIDIDPAHNMQGNAGKIPEWFGKCFEDAGFVWGKRWSSKIRDTMHFEFTRGL